MRTSTFDLKREKIFNTKCTFKVLQSSKNAKQRIINISLSIVLFSISSLAVVKPNNSGTAVVQQITKLSELVNIENKDKIYLSEKAINIPILIHASLIPQIPIATGSGLKSRIGYFVKKGEKLVLVETNLGQSISNEIPQSNHLYTFPIKEIKKNNNVNFFRIDIDKGLKHLFTNDEWRAPDFEGKDYSSEKNNQVKSVEDSYLKNAEIDSDLNYLIIDQGISMFDKSSTASANSARSTYIVRYYITPYIENPKFTSYSKPQNFERMGFFTVSPILIPNSGSKSHATKFYFDDNKKIKFYYSHNTPKKYVQAVVDGTLYWNKAFGKEVVTIEAAPEGITAPHPKYNLVQWLTWDDAGFAYADANADPLTGETKHAQVYLTSAFAISGIERAKQLIKNFNELHDNKVKLSRIAHSQRSFLDRSISNKSMFSFNKTSLCDREFDSSIVNRLEKILLMKITDAEKEEMILKASQDYVREVTAHEIGHTLGLRHNFAGSLSASYSISDREKIVKNYFSNPELNKDVITSSSVMEYQQFEESIISGDQIVTRKSPFEYDKIAIESLYLGKNYEGQKTPLYCTDTHASTYFDCQVFDIGRNPFEFLLWASKDGKISMLKSLMREFIKAKTPISGEAETPLRKVTLPPQEIFTLIMNYDDYSFLKVFEDKTKILQVRRNSEIEDRSEESIFKSTEVKYIIDELNKIDGLSRFFKTEDRLDINEYKESILSYVDTVKTGSRKDQKYMFTSNEVDYIKSRLSNYIDSLYPHLLKTKLKVLSGAPVFEEFGLTEPTIIGSSIQFHDLANSYYNLAKKIIMNQVRFGNRFLEDTNYKTTKAGSEKLFLDPESAEYKKLSTVIYSFDWKDYEYSDSLILGRPGIDLRKEALMMFKNANFENNIHNAKVKSELLIQLKGEFEAQLSENLANQPFSAIIINDGINNFSDEFKRWFHENFLLLNMMQ